MVATRMKIGLTKTLQDKREGIRKDSSARHLTSPISRICMNPIAAFRRPAFTRSVRLAGTAWRLIFRAAPAFLRAVSDARKAETLPRIKDALRHPAFETAHRKTCLGDSPLLGENPGGCQLAGGTRLRRILAIRREAPRIVAGMREMKSRLK